MLIEFSVENFRSIRELQTLSLIASSGKELQSTNIAQAESGPQPLLRSAVIYGPNAAGKSNFFRAAGFVQEFVLTSALRQEGAPIDAAPFAFCRETRAKPSAFSFTIVEGGIRYQYSLALTKERVTMERLVAYPSGHPQVWFERHYDDEDRSYRWHFGPNFKADKAQRALMQKTTRSNALFLSTSVQLNDDQLRPLFMWFVHKFAVINLTSAMNWQLAVEAMQDKGQRTVLNDLVRAADVGIAELDLREEELPQAPPGVQLQFQLRTGSVLAPSGSGAGIKQLRIVAMHREVDSDSMVALELGDESEGTQKFLQYAGGWIKALAEGATLFVDELGASLHPSLTQFLVELFHNSKRNPNGAQLVLTTHDTNLLNANIFRRDQIWFTEKDEHAASKLYPLLEFSPRKDEVLERGYLRGRYGAIPFIGDVSF